MKTSQYLIKFLVFAVLFFFASTLVYSTNKSSALLKNNQTLVVDFFRTDTVLIVMPDACVLNAIDKADIEHAIFWENDQLQPEYVYKTESEVTKQDLKNHILFYGCMRKFQRKEFFSIPIKMGKKGFRFDNKEFDQPSDSFFYVNCKANRMYLCKNDANSRHQFFTMGGTAYPLHIFSEDKIVITGLI